MRKKFHPVLPARHTSKRLGDRLTHTQENLYWNHRLNNSNYVTKIFQHSQPSSLDVTHTWKIQCMDMESDRVAHTQTQSNPGDAMCVSCSQGNAVSGRVTLNVNSDVKSEYHEIEIVS